MSLKLVHISDTHLNPFNPEPGDVLVHSGDALNYGTFEDLIKFRQQLESIKNNYDIIIFTPGNHDRFFESNFLEAESFLKETIPNLQILHERSFEHKGYKFYGTAYQPFFCNWAFNIKNPHSLYALYSNIPDDVNILITHCPAKGILDSIYGERVGSIELLAHLPRLKKLKAHLFGHIHYSAGTEKINDIYYSNAALVNEQYEIANTENIIELS